MDEFDMFADSVEMGMGAGAEGAATGMGEFGAGSIGDYLPDVGTGLAGAGQGGGGNWWSDFLGGAKGFGDFAKGALPFAQLGTAVLGGVTGAKAAGQSADQADTLKRAQGVQTRAGEQGLAMAGPLAAAGQQNLDRAAAGQIPDASRAMIENWARGAKAQLRDYFSRAGIGDSSMLAQEEAWIDQQAKAMEQQALQGEQAIGLQEFSGATGALAAGAGAAGGASQSAAQEQASLQQIIAAANQQLAKMAGSVAA